MSCIIVGINSLMSLYTHLSIPAYNYRIGWRSILQTHVQIKRTYKLFNVSFIYKCIHSFFMFILVSHHITSRSAFYEYLHLHTYLFKCTENACAYMHALFCIGAFKEFYKYMIPEREITSLESEQ